MDSIIFCVLLWFGSFFKQEAVMSGLELNKRHNHIVRSNGTICSGYLNAHRRTRVMQFTALNCNGKRVKPWILTRLAY